ncbi:MAG: CPBP family intramembrane metalloprotease [Desulfobacteraceae bacterium]|nr:CPBP family intramembrane metalloprotease [Desulfobacteraceae bacterium]MBU4054143.1 CPBP family intramembrane metalloprotease [Pseudomonadota bacterium]
MDTIKIDWKVFLGSLAVIGVTELLAGYAGQVFSGTHPLWLVGGARVVEIGLILLIAAFPGKGVSSIGLGSNRLWSGFKRGLLWSAGFGVAAALAGGAIFFAGKNPLTWFSSRLPGDLNSLILFFVVGGVVGPLAEEVFFRGICYGFFRRWGIMAALILTTLLFVSAHALKTGVPFIQIIGGVVFALAYEFEKNLMVPIVIHILGNLALFTLCCLAW